MKLLSCLFFLAVLSGCKAQTNTNNMIITYEAKTRGSSIQLNASSDGILYKDNETSKEIKPTAEFWDEINILVKEMKLSKLSSFVPPKDDRFVDAALHATLNISVGNKIYQSQTFDHGNPPKELKPLLDKLFDLLNLEKQN